MQLRSLAWAAAGLAALLVACGEDSGTDALSCGPGTIAAQGVCVPVEPAAGDVDAGQSLECGSGTFEQDGECQALAPDAGLVCGTGTREEDGHCVLIDAGPPVVCGDGTVLVDAACVPTPAPTCEQSGEVAPDPLATMQDFGAITGDPCAPQAAGTPYACVRFGNDYEIRSPTVFDGPAPGPEHFLRLAKVTGLDGEYDHNSIAFERTATGTHPLVVADFDLRITSRKGQRADGFGFALLNTDIYGAEGEVGSDAAEEPNFEQSIGVGFDILQTDGNVDIGNSNIRPGFANSVSIHYGDADPVPEDAPLRQDDFGPYGDLASGLWHHVRVSLRDAGGSLAVSVAITLPCGQIVPLVTDFEVAGVAPYEARAWFGARSGVDGGAEYDLANVRVEFMDADQSGVAFETREAVVGERGAAAELSLVRVGDLSQPAVVGYATRDLAARAGLDYATSCGEVAFAAGEAHATISVPIIDDAIDETRFDSAVGFSELVPNPAAAFAVALVHGDAATRVLGPAQATVSIIDDESEQRHGGWGRLLCGGITAVHASLLPSGKVLLADRLGQVALWTEASGSTLFAGPGHNLFCSGAALLGDGRLLIAGGHDDLEGAPAADGMGLADTVAFNPVTESWQPLADMNDARWYPTVTTLSDGTALVISGSVDRTGDVFNANYLPQVYLPGSDQELGAFRDLSDAAAQAENADAHGTEFYPWMIALPDRKAFKAGPDNTTWLLDATDLGAWTQGPNTLWEPVRDYGSAAFIGRLDRQEVMILGGSDPPTRAVERLDLGDFIADPGTEWELLAPLIAARRQQNATALPDGRLLVTGGCGGEGFNDLDNAVTAAELYQDGQWSLLPAATAPRGYHSTALLLPDGSVLTGGGGEGGSVAVFQSSLQIYYPDYFFKARPVLSQAPAAIDFGVPFVLHTTTQVAKVTLVRLGTPTHSFDQNQRYMELQFVAQPDGVSSVVAADGWTPPGDYLVFVLDANGVPSMGHFIKLGPALP